MDGAGVDVGGKRRFPSWMLGVAATDKVRKSDDGVANSEADDAPLSKVGQTASKTESIHTKKELLLCHNESDKATSCILAKCETKRKRKSSRKGADVDCDISKSGRTVEESAPQKRRRRKNLRLQSIQESEVLSQSDGDGELTMEDLMSIANEYVSADKDVEPLQLSNRDCEREDQLQSIASLGNVSRVSFSGPQTNENLRVDEAATFSYNSSDSLAYEGVVASTNRTGDPAQDMLNLFLGPLLKHPLEEEKDTKIMTEDVTFVPKYGKHSRNASIGEEFVTSMKKKSSLKDKVAMLLD